MEKDNRNKKKKMKRVTATTREVEVHVLEKKFKGGEEDGGAVGAAGDSVAMPTEEEVDEFFAILRRMKVAVKYFDDKGRGGKEWRKALEQPQVPVEDANNRHREEDGAVIKRKLEDKVMTEEGFDLNAIAPEAADVTDV